MKIRLTRKLADRIDGIDLTGRVVGEVFEVSPSAADILIAERWATPAQAEAATAFPPSPRRPPRR